MRVGADHRELVSISDSVAADLVGPIGGSGVCKYCRGWSTEGASDTCENCAETAAALGAEPLLLSVVSLYRKPSNLRDWLTRYKGRDDVEDPFDPGSVAIARAVLGRTLIEYGDDLTLKHGPIDGVVVVPSTTRSGPHPLQQIVESLSLTVPVLDLLERGPGNLGFRQPSRDGYIPIAHRPTRVMLLDDVLTTGARINSAAYALAQAGHRVVRGMVLARRINPDYATQARDLWVAATARRFEWKTGPWI